MNTSTHIWDTNAWTVLKAHAEEIKKAHLKELLDVSILLSFHLFFWIFTAEISFNFFFYNMEYLIQQFNTYNMIHYFTLLI